jgi:hypothetical protein
MGNWTRNHLGSQDGVRGRARRPRHRVVAATMVLSLVASAGIGTTSVAASSAATQGFLPAYLTGAAPSSVGIGFGGGVIQVNYLPTLLAMGAGYFNQVDKRFHTTIRFDSYASGNLTEAALLGGTDQFAEEGTANFMAPVLQGKDTVAALSGGVALGAVMMAPAKYESSRGTDISKFSPGTWCEIGVVGPDAADLKLVAGVYKLGLSKLNVTNIGSPASLLPTIQSGQCSFSSGEASAAAEGIVDHISYVPLNLASPVPTIPLAGEVLDLPLTTTLGFIHRYPHLAQAIIDATVKSLLFIQKNINNPTALYNRLPQDVTAAVTLQAFKGSFSLAKEAFVAENNNGSFTLQQIDDTVSFNEASQQIPPNAQADPRKLFVNKLVLQAYKDLGVKPAAGSPTGPETLPTTTGKPSAQAARAFAILTGQPAPANDGPAELGSGAGS